ncbi:MAG: 1,4-alpha-glucan branching protein GlgB [Candidatus Eisenbacteria bacterium]|nr:1,4-alpha-glucan branching protein GlgB [Candidatus Latescibacterota bacterium]MBD3301324.1 1,4-alpha-glucan branching protein GlgB [Candidatus Eisenbacteria bacterium]
MAVNAERNRNTARDRGAGAIPPHPIRLTDQDLFLFNEGTHYRLYEKMGSHVVEIDGVRGVLFAVWAPNAEKVSVIGDFNGWNRDSHPLRARDGSGIWEGFVPGLDAGTVYKYHIVSRFGGYQVDKADPFAMHHEVPPKTASVVWKPEYAWSDADWMARRGERQRLDRPISIYEVHLGSWRRVPEEGNRPLGYREIAPLLADHVLRMGFTHVELLPIGEHPFYGSWGYQSTGFFAPTSRYGTPEDFMAFIDTLHQNGIGVILDWVPSHFPTDEHGLSYFDGTHLFEHADPSQGYHPDWKSSIFNYGRNEVPSFLISSAFNWLDLYHIDGLRVDAVASMLYLDYSRKEGEWVPNRYGGRENLEAIDFLRKFNTAVYESFPDVQTIAEESTAWPMVSRPTYLGGLGFGMKWDMGWMHDTLKYLGEDPVHRKYHHHNVTFRMLYAFTENFVLPLSHDEVAHGKGSLWEKMPGDDWRRFANLRLLLGDLFLQPGKKLLFMGGELGQINGWNHDVSLDWHLLDREANLGITHWIRDLNRLYRSEPALHEMDMEADGFEWIDANDADQSVLSFVRRDRSGGSEMIVLLNFTPIPRPNYRVGVSRRGTYREHLNSDAAVYGGSGQGNLGGVEAVPAPFHGRPWSLTLTLPPLGMLVLKADES